MLVLKAREVGTLSENFGVGSCSWQCGQHGPASARVRRFAILRYVSHRYCLVAHASYESILTYEITIFYSCRLRSWVSLSAFSVHE